MEFLAIFRHSKLSSISFRYYSVQCVKLSLIIIDKECIFRSEYNIFGIKLVRSIKKTRRNRYRQLYPVYEECEFLIAIKAKIKKKKKIGASL